MGAAWGIVSGKFVITAAGLLIASRIDQTRLQALVDPHVASSAVTRSFAEQRHLAGPGAAQTATRHPLSIGIGAEEFDQPNLVIADHLPVPGADMVIGRDILSAHVISLDVDRRDLSLLDKGEIERLPHRFTAVPMTMNDEGQLRVTIAINGLRAEAALCLSQADPLEIGTSFWQSSPPARGEAAHITVGRAGLDDIAWPGKNVASDRVTLGLDAFKGRTIVLDLPHGRLWISTTSASQ